jgi:hypothetical protein
MPIDRSGKALANENKYPFVAQHAATMFFPHFVGDARYDSYSSEQD